VNNNIRLNVLLLFAIPLLLTAVVDAQFRRAGWSWRASLRVGRRFALLHVAGRAFWVGLGGGGWQVFGMSIENELQNHYALLLGIGSPWEQ